jgi:hypothetical protein
MPVFQTYSKRQKAMCEESADVYCYDKLPEKLKVQIVHIWNDVLGDKGDNLDHYKKSKVAYDYIVEIICRENGWFLLPNFKKSIYKTDSYEALINYFLFEENVEKLLDVIELSFVAVNRFTKEYNYLNKITYENDADQAIDELNIRFKENGVGYQFVGNEIIRIDSEYLHKEAVIPAIRILNEPGFEGAQDEFINAHDHYRHGRFKEALSECNKSFESTMKIICNINNWSFKQSDTSSKLIDICINNGLIKPFWQSNFNSLNTLLSSGVPTIRNKNGGHGQGAELTEVPEYLVSYMLHVTASTVLMLITAHKDIK